jgi:acetylornithine deacetylase/succinyl-diaminopimelate desuccinylase family protein
VLRDTILARLEADRAAIGALIEALVAIPTENPPGAHYEACAVAIERHLAALGLECARIDVPDPDGARRAQYPRSCVTASYGRGAPALYFHGHYDVVPASAPGQFAPARRDDSIFGRGAADMKGGLASMIYAAKTLAALGVPLGGRLALVFVPDEETGGALGSQHLAASGLLGAGGIGMLTPEPTSGAVWNASRGAISLEVTVKGRPAHVGLHYLGVNAFEQMLRVADRLLELKAEIESRVTGFRIEPEAARRSILLLGGRTEGGTGFNVVPGECRFTIDRRLNPEEDLATEKQRLLDVLNRARHDGVDLEVDVLQEGRAAGVDEQHAVARALARSVEAVTGRAPSFEMCPGLLEVRFYAERGVPAFAYGPGLLAVSHGPREFVKLDEVIRCAAVYAMTALDLLGAESP